MLAVMLVAVSPGSALAAPATAEFTGYGPGYSDVFLEEDAGSFNFNIGGSAVVAYCIQMTEPFSGASTTYSTAPLGTLGVPGDTVAAWIAINAGTVGIPLADVASEKAAIQVAMWVYTDNITIDEVTVESPSIRARASEIAAAAAGKSVASEAASFNLLLNASLNDDASEAVFTASTFTDEGVPLPGVDVTFTFPNSVYNVTLASGVDGIVRTFVPVTVAGGVFAGEVSANFKVAAGTLLLPADGSQILVTASSAMVVRTAVGSITVEPTGVPTATTTTTVPAVAYVAVTTTVPAPVEVPAEIVVTPPPTEEVFSVIYELPYTGGSFPTELLLVVIVVTGLALLAHRRLRRLHI